MLRRAKWTALLLLVCVGGSAIADDDPYAVARAQFLAAMSAVSTQPPEAPVVDSAALRTYPLYPYLQAARLARRLAALPTGADPGLGPLDSDVESFLSLYEDQPVTRDLRRSWLETLAARRAWTKYLEKFRPDRDTAIALRCQAATARVATGRNDGLADEARAIWLTPKSLPDACDPVVDWLRARGGIDAELTLRRARLALEEGESALARYLARSLPADKARPVLEWADLIEKPKSAITSLLSAPGRSVEDEALLDGWTRYARTDPAGAAGLFPALVESRRLDARHASAYALPVALAMAWNRTPGSLGFFARVHPDDFDERAYEWQARAALWAGDWTRVRDTIAAMPEALRNQTRWRYWSARAAERLGDVAAARATYAAVMGTDNWYAVYSAARLGKPFAPTLQPLSLSEAAITRLGTDPGFVRARELLACLMTNEATAEWRVAFEALGPEDQAQAVGLASRWGWHMQAIAAAARLGLFNDYNVLYPRPYDAQVRAAANRTGLPEELIYAIIRQESLYRPDAGSRAGALGLMQLMLPTARRTAARWDLPRPTRESLLDPAANVSLGAATLKSLVDRAAGQVPLAVAGYNAGPAAARRWLPPEPMETDVWVENIPYNETRSYVQRVAWHSVVFRWVRDRKPRDFSDWLGKISTPAPDAALQPH